MEKRIDEIMRRVLHARLHTPNSPTLDDMEFLLGVVQDKQLEREALTSDLYTLHSNERGNVRLLDADHFQEWAVTKLPDYSKDAYLLETMGITVNDPDKFNKSMGMMIMALGLIGEAAEASEMIKKAFGHGEKHKLTEEKHDKIDMEQGDGLFYHAALAHFRGRKLSDFFGMVKGKLNERYKKGFSSEESFKRVDVTKGVSDSVIDNECSDDHK